MERNECLSRKEKGGQRTRDRVHITGPILEKERRGMMLYKKRRNHKINTEGAILPGRVTREKKRALILIQTGGY